MSDKDLLVRIEVNTEPYADSMARAEAAARETGDE